MEDWIRKFKNPESTVALNCNTNTKKDSVNMLTLKAPLNMQLRSMCKGPWNMQLRSMCNLQTST